MANLSSCDSDILSKVPYSDTYLNDMINQVESQDAGIQDTNTSTPNNILVLSLVEQITDYVANLDKENQTIKMLNKIKDDFGKCFVTKKELSAEQAFWLKHSNYNPNTSVKSHTPVRIEAPSELPKVSLINESLKKLKYQLTSFDKVVKKRITSDAITTDILNVNNSCVDECNKCLELETELLKKKDLIEKDVYDKLLKSNTKNNKITQPPSRNQKNKVEEHPRNIKSSLKKKNSVSEPISNALVKHAVINAKVESMCAIYNKYLFDANHDMCLVDYVNDVNVHSKSKSKRNKMRKVWKLTSKVFTEIGYSWKPTRRIFTIAGNRCPLTRITATNEVPLKETTITPVITQSPALKVYSRKQKASRSAGPSSKAKIIESKTSNTKEHKKSWGSTISDVPSSSIIDWRFGNDHIAKIMGYGDYQMGNVTISQGSRGSNLYTLSLENLMLSSPIRLLSKASKTKSWLWHRRLSHLNFDYITALAKQGLVKVSLTEFELKKILLDKMQKSQSYRGVKEHEELYDGLVKSYKLNKDLFESYGKAYSLKRDREDKDKDEDPHAGSDQEI
ncbi:integrase, catalytic region, zinc finger, CCHC-type containing protein [Tanacetum coccineum]